MALEKQLINIPLTQGFNKKLDPDLLPGETLLSSTNLTTARNGSLKPRDGWTYLIDNSDTDQTGLYEYDNQLLVSTKSSGGNVLKTYSSASASLKTVSGKLPAGTFEKKKLYACNQWVGGLDCAIGGGYTCYVWGENKVQTGFGGSITHTGIYAMVLDSSTDAVVMAPTQLSSASTALNPRAAYVSNNSPSDAAAFVVIWGEGTTMKGSAIPTATFTPTSAASLRTDVFSFLVADMLSHSGSAIAAYISDGTGSRSVSGIMLKYNAGALTVTSGPIKIGDDVALPHNFVVSVCLCAFSSATTIGAFALNSSGGAAAQGLWAGNFTTTATALTAGTALANKDNAYDAASPASITAVLNGTVLNVFYDNVGAINSFSSSGGSTPVRTLTIDSSNTVTVSPLSLILSVGADNGINGPYIAGKAFLNSSTIYLPMWVGGTRYADSNPDNCFILYDVNNGFVAGRALTGTYGAWGVSDSAPYQWTPPTVIGTAQMMVPERGPLATDLATQYDMTPVGFSRLTFTPGFPGQSVRLADSTFFPGSFLAEFDGARVFESGFHVPPYITAIADGAAGSVTVGLHSYVAVYEWYDANGNRHQSQPSLPFSYDAPGAKKATITITSTNLSQKPGILIAIYRTEAAKTTYYRVTQTTTVAYNDSTGAAVTFSDNIADTALVDADPLDQSVAPGDGLELPHSPPPPCSSAAVHQNRLFLFNLEDQQDFWFSQEPVPTQGLAFNDGLAGTIRADVGGLTAGVSMDNRLILFTDTRKLLMDGSGPSPSGMGGSYQTPLLLPTDVGCVEPRSIVQLPDVQTPGPNPVQIPGGVAYQSKHGLYKLDRALQDSYIGQPAEPYFYDDVEGALPVTSGVVLVNYGQARWTTENGVVVYDYMFNTWGEFESSLTGAVPYFACNYGDCWTFIDYGGDIYRELVGALYDTAPDSTTGGITTTFRTGFVKLSAIDGFQRARFLAMQGAINNSGATTLSVSVYINYGNTASYTATYGGLQSTVFGGDQYSVRHRIRNQKCASIGFAIEATQDVTLLGNISFSALTLEVGVKRGTTKVPAVQTF